MADVVEYRQRLEKPRRCPDGEARLLSMQNERDEGYRRARDEQKQRQLQMALAVALRGLYIAYGDTLVVAMIKENADLEARKILQCQT